MPTHKKYTDKDAKLHKIVKALQKIGHTDIEVTWANAMSQSRGWTVKTKQWPYVRFYGDLDSILIEIEKKHKNENVVLKNDWLKGIAPGELIQFHSVRLFKGNPVQGKFINTNDTFFDVELTKDVVGLADVWYTGETKGFRIELCNDFKKIEHANQETKNP